MKRTTPKKAKPIKVADSGIFTVTDDGGFAEETDFTFGSFPDKHVASSVNSALVLQRAMDEAKGIQYTHWFDVLTPEEMNTLAARTDAEREAGYIRPCPPIVKDATQVLQLGGAAIHYYQKQEAEAAAYFAFKTGMAYQRMLLRAAENLAQRGRGQLKALAKGPTKKRADAQADYERINEAVAAHIKKRGRHKQPSLTTIRKRVADELQTTYSKVLDAQRGGRKQNIRK
jgi:hypothetical protein